MRQQHRTTAVTKGEVLFAHPRQAQLAVEYGLQLGDNAAVMTQRPGAVMGYLAYSHPVLDGDGRTIIVMHSVLAERAGLTIDWSATDKNAYLDALSKGSITAAKATLTLI